MGIVAVVVIVLGSISAGLVLLLTTPGLMAAFVAVWALIATAGCGATLLAIDFLFPQAVVFPGLVGLLWLVIPAALVSATLFDLVLEGWVLTLLKRTGLELPRIWMIEAFVSGLFLALALGVTAGFLSDTHLSPAAALAAGLISAFVRYYLGLWFDDAVMDEGATPPDKEAG